MHLMSLPALTGFFLIVSITTRTFAEILPSTHVRAAAVEAHTIVVAHPVNDQSLPAFPRQSSSTIGEFVVEEVFRGEQALVSQTLKVDHRDVFVRKQAILREAAGVEIKSALLFLDKEDEGSWRLNYVYIHTPDGRVMRPLEAMDQSSYVLADPSSTSWEEIKRILRTFLPQEGALRSLREIADPAERNRRLFAWIRTHENEFLPLFGQRGQPEEPRTGWGILHHEVFDWIEEAGIPADSWLAMQLHADVRGFGDKRWPASQSMSRLAHGEGRAFLLEKLLDDKQPLVARRTAAASLSAALNPGWLSRENPRFTAVSLQEQEDLIRAVLPLMNHDDSFLRHEVISLLLKASDPFNDASRPQRTKLAHAAVAAALLKETDPAVLDGLPETLNHLMDEAEWQLTTGNTGRILVTLFVHVDGTKLRVHANGQHLPKGASLPVEVTLERLDEDEKVQETVTRQSVSKDGKPWLEDHQGFGTLEDIHIPNLAAGLWRVRVTGTSADEGKPRWTSWHTCLRVP